MCTEAHLWPVYIIYETGSNVNKIKILGKGKFKKHSVFTYTECRDKTNPCVSEYESKWETSYMADVGIWDKNW